MSQRANWEDIYGIRTHVTGTLSDGGVGADAASVWNSATVTTGNFISGAMGIDTSKYAIPLLNHPTFDPGATVINQRKAVGTSYRRSGSCLEYQMGARVPTVTYECDATYKIMALFFQLLFQGGATQGAGDTYTKTYVPYAEGDSAVVACAALIRQMSAGTANSHVIGGAIIKSLSLSAEEGQPLKATAEFTGYNMVSDYDFDAEANILEFDSTACLMFQNCTVELATTAVNIDKFDLTITNNAVAKFYNTPQVTKYVLGDFTASGSIRIPWAALTIGGNTQIDNFVNGTECLLQIFWGHETATSAGDVIMNINARYTGATVEGEDEIVTTLPFEAVHDGTDAAIQCFVVDGIDRSIV